MTNTFKISATYWNNLSEKEKFFMQSNAINHGVSYCKRILTLVNVFPGWDDIVPADVYIHDVSCKNSWLVFHDGKMIGMIFKSLLGFGVTEKIHVRAEQGFTEIWNNWKTKNPNSSEKHAIATAVLSRIA